jgi:hypothetical protein
VLAAALGVSALLASSALAFAAVKYAGAGYLIYIGVRRILSLPDTLAAQSQVPRRSLARLYRDGFVVNLRDRHQQSIFSRAVTLHQYSGQNRDRAAHHFLFSRPVNSPVGTGPPPGHEAFQMHRQRLGHSPDFVLNLTGFDRLTADGAG